MIGGNRRQLEVGGWRGFYVKKKKMWSIKKKQHPAVLALVPGWRNATRASLFHTMARLAARRVSALALPVFHQPYPGTSGCRPMGSAWCTPCGGVIHWVCRLQH